ncbi:imidazole glycerol phosphate synthase subunit HisH 1 [bacterium BMS3Bbin12]|nr:imidazole glycerol phosphate synthase subunit HisH 1 [bacterium BMS3Abin12]GBE47102.1 imidazole glycerol phosphate synthase subunit HisH 1 [bacterium BMS3Bbin12]GBE51357.1 imidazole glycerol phosphate synthase subunit HisH 1 [bacterium BMS3Bbin13]
MNTVAIIDYGMSNLRSVHKALEHVAPHARIYVTDDPRRVREAARIVFPGQGAIGECMERLRARGLDEAIVETLHARPFLGICLGLQALMGFSEENGGTPGLGAFPGSVVRFPEDARDPDGGRLKIPHMGWNEVHRTRDHPLWDDIARDDRFYFVHSYHVVPEDGALVAATTPYAGGFASALARDNIFAVQFHPEKSQRAGLTLLRNFLRWDGTA